MKCRCSCFRYSCCYWPLFYSMVSLEAFSTWSRCADNGSNGLMSNKLPSFMTLFNPRHFVQEIIIRKKLRLKGMTGSNLINEKYGFELIRYDKLYFAISVVRTVLNYFPLRIVWVAFYGKPIKFFRVLFSFLFHPQTSRPCEKLVSADFLICMPNL